MDDDYIIADKKSNVCMCFWLNGNSFLCVAHLIYCILDFISLVSEQVWSWLLIIFIFVVFKEQMSIFLNNYWDNY